MSPTGQMSSTALDRLRDERGNFSMLALDQRESLRAMFPRRGDGSFVDDATLVGFKAEAARLLTPYASAVLLDRPYGLPEPTRAVIDPSCAVIVAADVLHQEAGAPVTHTTVDEQVTVDYLREVGASAVKFLVMWAPTGQAERAEAVGAVVELARSAGIASLVEGVVRRSDGRPWEDEGEWHEAILAAAEELAPLGADLYKAEVPGYSPGRFDLIAEHSRRLSAIVPCEWVVLSNGVQRAEFAAALEQACAGGASGFLAGRAIWSDVFEGADISRELVERSIPRLSSLSRLVDDRVKARYEGS